MAELAKVFGQRVRELRLEQGLTQSGLAERAHVSEEWVRRMERGDASPSFTTLETLAAALHVQVSGLFAAEPATAAQRFADVTKGLDEAAVQWLLAGARLLKR